jgi:hypothetical protein
MIPKAEWQSVSHDLMAERRADAGDPPTADQILAYTRGELSGEDEERVRELLVCYPELARTLTEPVPDPRPGEPGYRSENELAQRWMALQQRIGMSSAREQGRALQIWRGLAAVAATVAIVSSAMLWDARNRLAEPHLITDVVDVQSAVSRGTGSTAVISPAGGEAVLLALHLTDTRFSSYRLEISDAAAIPPRSLWRTALVEVPESGILSIVVPHAFLPNGRYQIDVYGLSADGEQHVEMYAVQWRAAVP